MVARSAPAKCKRRAFGCTFLSTHASDESLRTSLLAAYPEALSPLPAMLVTFLERSARRPGPQVPRGLRVRLEFRTFRALGLGVRIRNDVPVLFYELLRLLSTSWRVPVQLLGFVM